MQVGLSNIKALDTWIGNMAFYNPLKSNNLKRQLLTSLHQINLVQNIFKAETPEIHNKLN